MSVITVGELRVGVLVADDIETRNRRLSTVAAALSLEPLPLDGDVADAWERLRVSLREAGRRMPVNDSWIADPDRARRLRRQDCRKALTESTAREPVLTNAVH